MQSHHDTAGTDLAELEHRTPANLHTSRWQTIWAYAREPFTWALIAGALVAIAVAAGVLYGLWWLLSALFTGIANLAEGIAAGASGSAEPIVRTITDPVHRYIHTHAYQLPATPETLWWGWLITVGGLFLLAVLGSRGARYGWAAIGAVTTAMVWAGSTPDTQVLAAGVTTAAWAVLSVLAFNQLTSDPKTRVVIFRPEPSQPSTTE